MVKVNKLIGTKNMGGKFIVKILCSACILQILLTFYFILKIYVSTSVARPDQIVVSNNYDYEDKNSEFKMSYLMQDGDYFDRELQAPTTESVGSVRGVLSKKLAKVEVITKAAIGIYLWEHILEASKAVDIKNPSLYSGHLLTSEAVFLYSEGPGVEPDMVGLRSKNIVLIINGRTEEKINESRKWLDHLHKIDDNVKILLIILGNERCENSWLSFYMKQGRIKSVLMVYDDPSVDGKHFFQWPLGVATYRQFPTLTENQVLPTQPRQYKCNLQATNYANGTRRELFELLKSFTQDCFVQERTKWKPTETSESMNEYIKNLISSDLTLCPAGFNTETYRVYEAMAAGSVPVIEDVPSKGSCNNQTGWRILKLYNPPVIWVKNWKELKVVLESEAKMTESQKLHRRKRLLNWYEWFKLRLRDHFMSLVQLELLKPD